ncbi:putative O-methyltransferase [Streptomyces lydicamycinicus]|uniref:Putative O-methyltransferase n=1 Tax=Streptomyces lydicamycinicus TaxID=1546107 RepID=A0A0P4R728_9ACTN|nr:putative O-methyltransferase [Streptomyces lydicamycinicus]
MRWLCLDIEHDGPAELSDDGYDLITLRLVFPFLHNRTRVLDTLAARLRPHGALVVITPVVATTPEERRHIALDEEEISLLAEGWSQVERLDAKGLAVLVLRHPARDFTAVEKGRGPSRSRSSVCVRWSPTAPGACCSVGRRGACGSCQGGRVEAGESFQAAAVRELAEETGLMAGIGDAHLLTVLHDDRADVRRLSAVVRISAWAGRLGLPEPHRFRRWEWHDLHALSALGVLFAPTAHALEAVWPGVLRGLPPVHSYAHASTPPVVGGEPAEAVRMRQEMAERVIAGGWAPSDAVEDALRTVPRHRFTPESPLRTAYDDDLAIVTSRDAARHPSRLRCRAAAARHLPTHTGHGRLHRPDPLSGHTTPQRPGLHPPTALRPADHAPPAHTGIVLGEEKLHPHLPKRLRSNLGGQLYPPRLRSTAQLTCRTRRVLRQTCLTGTMTP